jgi:hypothetical protein
MGRLERVLGWVRGLAAIQADTDMMERNIGDGDG